MQGVILAAGKGKRLQPVTPQRTKAMAPVAGKPMVERVIDLLVENGITDFILLVSPEDGEIIPHFQQQRPELTFRFLVQHERLGMAHALSLAAPYIHGDFVLSACDNLTPADHIAALLATHRTRQANATLSLMAIDIAQSASTGIVDWHEGWIRRIVEKPKPEAAPSNISSLPLYIFSTRLLTYLPQVQLSPRGEYELQDAIQLLIDHEGRVTGVCTESRMQLTNIADLLALNRHYLSLNSERQILSHSIDSSTQLIAPLRIDQDVTIGPGCIIGPHVYIEASCRIGAGVRLADTVVLRGARVADQTAHAGEIIF
jgi:NDP-sugar pyrophosphorylase family protein